MITITHKCVCYGPCLHMMVCWVLLRTPYPVNKSAAGSTAFLHCRTRPWQPRFCYLLVWAQLSAQLLQEPRVLISPFTDHRSDAGQRWLTPGTALKPVLPLFASRWRGPSMGALSPASSPPPFSVAQRKQLRVDLSPDQAGPEGKPDKSLL